MLVDHLQKRKKERIKKNKIKKTGDSRYIYQNEIYKASFQHDMAYGDFKDLTKRIASDKILREKALILPKILNMIDIKEVLV